MRMSLWTSRLIVAGASLFFLGCFLLAASVIIAGPELITRAGGAMVYVAIPLFGLALGVELLSRLFFPDPTEPEQGLVDRPDHGWFQQ